MNAKSLLACCLLAPLIVSAQTPNEPSRTAAGPWFGVALPPKMGAEPAVLVGERAPRPVQFAEASPAELQGARIRKDVDTIVGFSKKSRESREIGSGQLWGRVSGFASSDNTVEWAVEELRRAGIADVKVQPIVQDAESSLWLPLSWEVRVLGDAAFGVGSADVVLQSAMPLRPSSLSAPLTAPLVYVGAANAAVAERIDVKGKIAVQLVIPQGHMVFERGSATPRAQSLMKRGAVAVLNLVRLPGNEHAFDLGNCGGPCFNIGGRDGWFLENVLEQAAVRRQHNVRARLTLTSESRKGLSARNGVAVIPGRSAETIVIDAHADAWFDGAGDNADGLAVTLALARYFAKRPQLDRTLVFVISAGHHTPGINGPRSFVKANPELASRAAFVINVEHVAQRNFSAARSVAQDGYRHAAADTGEAPIAAGVTNGAPFIDALLTQSVERFGVNFVSEKSTMQSGETGGFADIKAAKLTLMQAPPLYHTSGEVADVISTPGLERIARSLAFLIEEAAKAPRERINP
jgi:hypothetical protein